MAGEFDISAYLDTQGEEVSRQMTLEGRPVPGDSISWRCGLDTINSNNTSGHYSSTPLTLQSTSNHSHSTSSGRSSRGATPPIPLGRLAKFSSCSLPARSRRESEHSRSPKAESCDQLEKQPLDDSSYDPTLPSDHSLPDVEKEEGVFPSALPPHTAYTGRRSYNQHTSKLGSSGYYPSASSFNSCNSAEKTKLKRKSWINNALNPTYTSRCEDLRRNFPGLPPDQILLGDYSCALQKDILVHGRIFVTNNFLCFYANIFKWETAVTILWKDVSAMTKEKTALVIPNAIQICVGTEKLFFCSFATRDKTHMTLFRVWQNALMNSPASQTELWSWIQSSYGERSSRISDVENDVSNDGGSNHSYDGLDSVFRPRIYSNIQEENEENNLAVNVGSFLPDQVGDKPMRPACNKSLDSLPTDLSDNTESEHGERVHRTKPGALRGTSSGSAPSTRPGIVSTDILTYEVWRQSKDAREILSKNFKFNIDDLFTLLFTNSKFFYDFQAERKTFDIVQCPWQQAENSDEKFRKVEFTLNLNHAMGPKTSRATEVQRMRATSVPGHIYSVDVETINADIPYGDTFFVISHYCLVKVGEEESRLTVLCDIKYRKTPWGLIKSFIDKNVWAGIGDHYAALSTALDREVQERREEGMKDQGLPKKKTRRQRNRKVSVTDTGPVNCSSMCTRLPSPGLPVNTQVERRRDSKLNLVLMVLLCFLCILNVFLLFKIWSLEYQISSKIDLFDDFMIVEQPEARGPKSASDWLRLLQLQETRHKMDLQSWQEAVKTASGLLQQTESAMSAFSKSFQAETNRKLLRYFLQEQELETDSQDVNKHLDL